MGARPRPEKPLLSGSIVFGANALAPDHLQSNGRAEAKIDADAHRQECRTQVDGDAPGANMRNPNGLLKSDRECFRLNFGAD